jgi:SAM-dependent methyltransferase
MLAKKVMTSLYERASCPDELPWHQPELPAIVRDALRALPAGARVLDVGCGAGTFAVQIAKRGFDVTAVDLIPKALELGRELALKHGAKVDFVEADVVTWLPPAPFDLVLDSGCLHSLIGRAMDYKNGLLGWLVQRGDFVLGHWGKRHGLDWRPVGPRRRTRRELRAIFAPEFEEHAHVEELMTGVPLPFGPTVLGLGLWFKKM